MSKKLTPNKKTGMNVNDPSINEAMLNVKFHIVSYLWSNNPAAVYVKPRADIKRRNNDGNPNFNDIFSRILQ